METVVPAAARIGDITSHPGTILPPVPPLPGLETVLIEDRPAAVVGCVHGCGPHAELGPANRVLPAPSRPPTVLVSGLPLACVGDPTVCGATIESGAPTVVVGGGL
jgi:uncharacterized Zn-binding protein involved in type VI secretion